MRKRFGFLSMLVVSMAAVFFVSGCGSGSGGGHNPPPPATGLTIFPASVTLTQGQTAQLTAYLGPAPTSATWSVTSGTGTINTSTGLFTAPTASETDIIQAVAGSNGGTATIVVSGSAQSVVISPSAIAIPAGTSQTFSTTTAGVAWTVNGIANGSSTIGFITSGGVYTAPLAPPPGGAVTISAVSGANSGTATATILFSNASLNSYVTPFSAANPQPYAFAYTGDDSSGFLSVAGSFVADGNGNIVSGVEDVNAADLMVPETEAIDASTYTVGPDGRTTANITTQLGGSGIVWQFTLISNQHALMVRFDGNATGSGTVDLQDPTQFNTPFANGTYVFSLSGAALDSGGSLFPAGIVGRFSTAGGMSIPLNSAILDINDTASTTPIITDLMATGTFTSAVATGRGTLTLDCPTFDESTFFGTGTAGTGTLTFIYYIIDATHIKLVESDAIALFAGDIYSAPLNPVNTNLDTSAFVVGGTDTNGNPYGLGGVFITTGGSGIGGALDINDAGNLNDGGSVTDGENITSTSASLDTTTGRIGLTIAASSGQSYGFAAYPFTYNALNGMTATGAVMLETDSNVAVGTGISYTQTSTATSQGSFAFNLTGIASSGEQDVTGQFATGTGGALAGTLDINDIANSGDIVSGAPLLSGSAITPVIANGRGNPLTLAAVNPSYVLSYYVIDANTALLLEMDNSRVMTGTMVQQF